MRSYLLALATLALIAGCKNSSSGSTGCPSPFMMCGTTCTATQVDPANCGTCGNACAAGQLCLGGSCVASCSAPNTACGQACVDLQSDGFDCGACGHACGPGQICLEGVCR